MTNRLPVRGMLMGVWLSLAVLPTSVYGQDRWTPELSLDVSRLSDLSFSPDGGQLLYAINQVDLENDRYLTQFVVSDLNGTTVRTLLEPSPHISAAQWSPDGRQVAFLSSQSGTTNIWLVDVDGSNQRQITRLNLDVSSFQWAPDSRAIAFTMLDDTYTDPGVMDSNAFNPNRLWLLRLDNGNRAGTVVNLTADQPFSVSGWSGAWAYDWAPDSKTIAFAYQDRPGLQPWTKAQLATVDVENWQVTPIDVGNDRWKYFPKYSPDGKWLAFINAPGPFKWSFLWDIKLWPVGGGATVELPPSKNRLPFIWQWAPDSESIFYIENDRITYSFYEMPVDGSASTKIFGSTDDLAVPGLNTYLTSSFIDVSPDGGTLVYIGQTYNTPPEIYTSYVSSFLPIKISKINQRFYDIPVGKTELIAWNSLDNTPVEGLLTYPQIYQKGMQYPLVVQIHGGPNGVDFNEYLPLMRFFSTASYAADGYFVLRVNYRGTLGYGRNFREALIGQFGILDYQDIMSGVNHVINRNLVDPDQLFLIGQSNGGTLTSWIITQTDRFRSACPIAGETDYISLEGTNGYFQTSWYLGGSFVDNLQVFLDRSPIFHVKTVKTPTLIQGGLMDDNVPFGQLREFYRALKRVGVDVRLVGYPGADHDFYPPKLYLRLLESCLDFTKAHTPN